VRSTIRSSARSTDRSFAEDDEHLGVGQLPGGGALRSGRSLAELEAEAALAGSGSSAHRAAHLPALQATIMKELKLGGAEERSKRAA